MSFPRCRAGRGSGLALLSIALACASCAGPPPKTTGDLFGEFVWDHDFRFETPPEPFPYTQAKGTAYLLLEEHYGAIGYDGPPPARVRMTDDVEARLKELAEYTPEGWDYITPERLSEPGMEHLLRAPVDATGHFEFSNIPEGTHTLFILWGNNPDPCNCRSGPFEVVIRAGEESRQGFVTSRFDTIDT